MPPLRIHRRELLRFGAVGALGAATARAGLAARRRQEDPGEPRTLVLVQLAGGNDGLATFDPYGARALSRLRPTIARKNNELLELGAGLRLHPNLARLAGRWKKRQLAIVEGVGYPSADRSHFKSFEIWHTADLRGKNAGDGWVGRLAAASWAESEATELVVHLGREAPHSLFSRVRQPIALESPTSYRWFGAKSSEDSYERAADVECSDARGPHAGRDAALARLRATLEDATESSRAVRSACAGYATPVEYPRDPFGARLRDIAALIQAGLGARVLSATLGGFDTHSGQVARHDTLMQRLDGGLGALLDDLERTERGRNTLVVAFSEFGRRVRENGSKGTDHGQAGPVFIAGPRVQGGLFGKRPSLDDLDRGDLRFTTDFRSVYATVIGRWFGADSEAILGARFPVVPFV